MGAGIVANSSEIKLDGDDYTPAAEATEQQVEGIHNEDK